MRDPLPTASTDPVLQVLVARVSSAAIARDHRCPSSDTIGFGSSPSSSPSKETVARPLLKGRRRTSAACRFASAWFASAAAPRTPAPSTARFISAVAPFTTGILCFSPRDSPGWSWRLRGGYEPEDLSEDGLLHYFAHRDAQHNWSRGSCGHTSPFRASSSAIRKSKWHLLVSRSITQYSYACIKPASECIDHASPSIVDK